MAQFDPATLLLETLRSVSEASRLPEALPASQVNRIGISLGFTDTELLRLLTSLSDSGEVELQWGGNLKVMRPRPTGHVIHLERGATLVQNSVIGAGAAVGSNAMAAGAVRGPSPREKDHLDAIAKLTAAIMLMRESLPQLEGETRRQSEHAVEEAQEILPKLQTDQPDKGDLAPRLKKADEVLGILTKVTTIASATFPGLPQAINLMHQGLTAAFRLLGGS